MNAELTEQAEAAREAGAAAGSPARNARTKRPIARMPHPRQPQCARPALYRSSYEHDACASARWPT